MCMFMANPEPREDRRRRLGLAGAVAGLARRPYRPAALAIAAAVVGLALASAGLFRPAQHEATSTPPGDVALVNQQPILMTDFVNELEQSKGVSFADSTAADRAEVLRRMIDEELLVQRALALDLPEQDTNVRSALSDSVNALTAAPVLDIQPTDDQLHAFYAAHRANYATQGSMNLTDLVLHVGGFENAAQTFDQALADAKQAVYELRSGAPIDYAKDHFGFVDSGRVSPQEQDFSARLHLGPKLYAVAVALNDGTISEPVADADGVHILIMDRRQPPIYYDYDSVRNNVYADYQTALKAKARRDNLAFLRRNAQIFIAPGQHE
jgi:hypothetical protein